MKKEQKKMINLYHMKRNELFKDYYRRISNTQKQNQHIQSDSPAGCSNMIFFFFPPGPLLGYPVWGVSSLIHSVSVEPGTSPAMVSACVSRCMLKVDP